MMFSDQRAKSLGMIAFIRIGSYVINSLHNCNRPYHNPGQLLLLIPGKQKYGTDRRSMPGVLQGPGLREIIGGFGVGGIQTQGLFKLLHSGVILAQLHQGHAIV